MANYNVQMKQFNGTSFDNILPHAYLADKATDADHATSADSANTATILDGGGGATEIITTARSGLSQIATGSYVGNGTVGESNAVTIQCGFKPKFLWVYAETKERYGSSRLTSTIIYRMASLNDSTETYKDEKTVFENSGFWVSGNDSQTLVYSTVNNKLGYRFSRVFIPNNMSVSIYAEKTDTTQDVIKPWMQLNIAGTTYHWVAIGETTT